MNFSLRGCCLAKQPPCSLSSLSPRHPIKNLMWTYMRQHMRSLTCNNVLITLNMRPLMCNNVLTLAKYRHLAKDCVVFQWKSCFFKETMKILWLNCCIRTTVRFSFPSNLCVTVRKRARLSYPQVVLLRGIFALDQKILTVRFLVLRVYDASFILKCSVSSSHDLSLSI